MVDYSDEINTEHPDYIKEYKEKWNNSEQFKNNDLLLVSASFDKIKNLFFIIIFCLFLLGFIIYFLLSSSFFNPIINNNHTINNNVPLTNYYNQSFSLNPVFNVEINLNQSSTFVNYTITYNNFTYNTFNEVNSSNVTV